LTGSTLDAGTLGTVARARRRVRIKPHRIAIFVFLLMAALFFCVPLYVIVVTSFKTMDQIRLGQILSLPDLWTLDGWRYAWFEACSGSNCGGLSTGFWNSVKILIPSLILSVSLSVVTGYAMALWKVKWANALLFTMFICAFVPFQVIMFPLIRIAASLGIFGTTTGVAVVHAALAMPILTLIFTNYFKGIPEELVSAAMLDSGSFWNVFLQIVLPMSGNILVVVFILQITGIWNDFLVGVTFGGTTAQPMTVVLNNMNASSTSGTSYGALMAGALLTAAPPLIIYFLLGKFFIQGITAGALKG
jgi:glucose/mannose transport system permease protein